MENNKKATKKVAIKNDLFYVKLLRGKKRTCSFSSPSKPPHRKEKKGAQSLQVSLELNLMHFLKKLLKELCPRTQLVVFISFPPEYFFSPFLPWFFFFFWTFCPRVMSFEPLDLSWLRGWAKYSFPPPSVQTPSQNTNFEVEAGRLNKLRALS